MAAERYLSPRIPDLRVGNNIDKIDKKPVPSIYTSLVLSIFEWCLRQVLLYCWISAYSGMAGVIN